MRTFKKDDRILQTNDNIIADAILNSGFKEVEATPVKDELPEVPQDDEVEATPKNKRNKRGN